MHLNRLKSLLLVAAVGAVPASATLACGWWGDPEMRQHGQPEIIFAPLPKGGAAAAAKLPGRMGYGLAIPDPGQAQPYLEATFGRPVNRIDELHGYGFRTVIDLGTPPETAQLHRRESEKAGFVYHNIPLKEGRPEQSDIVRFSELVVGAGRHPTLVFAPNFALLGIMWTGYRIHGLGAPAGYAISEGRSLGMSEAQADELLKTLGAAR